MDTSLSVQERVHSVLSAQVDRLAAPVNKVERPGGDAYRAGQEVPREDAVLAGVGYGQLRTRQDGMNDLAQLIRREDLRVEMRKLFPPYPPEQEARMAYLDRISGLRERLDGLMVSVVQLPDARPAMQGQADSLAGQISLESRRMLAGLSSKQAISANRPLLETVAQNNPVQ